MDGTNVNEINKCDLSLEVWYTPSALITANTARRGKHCQWHQEEGGNPRVYTLAGSWWDKSGFLHQKGLGAWQRYLLPRWGGEGLEGQSKVLKPQLWLWVFWANFYTLVGSEGDESVFLLQKGLWGWHRYLQLRWGCNPRFWNPFYDFGFFEQIFTPWQGHEGTKVGFCTRRG